MFANPAGALTLASLWTSRPARRPARPGQRYSPRSGAAAAGRLPPASRWPEPAPGPAPGPEPDLDPVCPKAAADIATSPTNVPASATLVLVPIPSSSCTSGLGSLSLANVEGPGAACEIRVKPGVKA